MRIRRPQPPDIIYTTVPTRRCRPRRGSSVISSFQRRVEISKFLFPKPRGRTARRSLCTCAVRAECNMLLEIFQTLVHVLLFSLPAGIIEYNDKSTIKRH